MWELRQRAQKRLQVGQGVPRALFESLVLVLCCCIHRGCSTPCSNSLRKSQVLLNASGEILDPAASIGEVGLEDGDALTLRAQPVRIAAPRPWDASPSFGKSVGHHILFRKFVSAKVQCLLTARSSSSRCLAFLVAGVIEYYHSLIFAPNVRSKPLPFRKLPELVRTLKLKTARSQGFLRRFCCVLADGSVVAWGEPLYGGDCSAVQEGP